MKKMIIPSTELFFNNDNDRIMYVISKVFNATSLETAVTLEQVIEKGIELGLCETYPRGKEDGHPWYPHTSTMCGIHKDGTGNANYEQYLHRAFVKKEGSKSKVFVYWVDKSRKAEVIGRNGKPVQRNAKVVEKTAEIYRETRKKFTPEQAAAKAAENPEYIVVNDRVYVIRIVLAKPWKFDPATVAIAKMRSQMNEK